MLFSELGSLYFYIFEVTALDHSLGLAINNMNDNYSSSSSQPMIKLFFFHFDRIDAMVLIETHVSNCGFVGNTTGRPFVWKQFK